MWPLTFTNSGLFPQHEQRDQRVNLFSDTTVAHTGRHSLRLVLPTAWPSAGGRPRFDHFDCQWNVGTRTRQSPGVGVFWDNAHRFSRCQATMEPAQLDGDEFNSAKMPPDCGQRQRADIYVDDVSVKRVA